MFEFETSFRKAIRGLKSPLSSAFDPRAWDEAIKNTKGARTTADLHLAAAGLWISVQSAAVKAHYDEVTFDLIGRSLWVVLGVAFSNREFRTADALQRDHFKAKPKSAHIDMSYEPLLKDAGGRTLSHSGINQSLVDMLESWMFDLRDGAIESANPPIDLWPSVSKVAIRTNILRELNRLWNQALWEGYQLDTQGERLIWVPGDRHIAQVLEATRIRHEEYTKNLALIDLGTWPAMPPKVRSARMLAQTVTAVRKPRGGPRKFRVGKPSNRSRAMNPYAFETAILEGSYLSHFMDRQMPAFAPLTAATLLKAWHVLIDLARLIQEPLPERSLSVTTAHALALVVKRSELVSVLVQSLSVDQALAEAIIGFLSFEIKKPKDKGHRGFWAAPLVQIPGGERYAICLGALISSNPLRKVEAWLEKGGIDDSLGRNDRGDDYEAFLRHKLQQKIYKNELLTVTACAKHAIKKTKHFPEQIDLLIRLGSLLIVGEVKCWLFPAESYERWEYIRKLTAASDQAKRKASAIDHRRDVAAKALGVAESELVDLKVIPLIVTNQGFAASTEIDGCRVVDERLLSNYLASGSIVTNAISVPGVSWKQRSTVLYSNESEAAARFETYIARPSVLYRFYDRIIWDEFPFPTADRKGLFLMSPRLREIESAHVSPAHAASPNKGR